MFSFIQLKAQTVTTFNSTGATQTWTCPAGIDFIQVEVWGAGGGGGNSNNTTTNGGSGGGGGAYSRSLLAVTPGTTYTLFVGAGGAGAPNASTTSANDGEDSWFANSTTSVLAKGGTRGLNNDLVTPGSGGLAGSGVGQVKFSGGDGNVAATNAGGAGGSSAGTEANGVTETSINTLSYAPNGGGYGGEGESSNTGSNGAAPGGGGGGSNDATAAFGGNGGDGKIVITEAVSNAATQEYFVPGIYAWQAPACVTTVTVTAFGAGGGGGSNNNGGSDGGSGGGGGAYSANVLTVTPGNTYSVVVGAGGQAGIAYSSAAATAGGDTWFASSTNSLLAKGGGAGANDGGAAGIGGAAGSGIGTTKFSGGNGGVGDGNSGQGGGSSAGTAGNGNVGGNPTAGAAPAGGYAGGEASTAAGDNGDNGATYGGGGGGSNDDNTSFGGNGGGGYISIASAPTVTMADYALTGQSVTATSNGDNIPIHALQITVGACGTTLSGFGFTTTGDYLLSDINAFDLYLTSTTTFSTSDSLSSVATPAVAGAQVYQSFSKALAAGTYYLWVTVDLTRTAVNGRTLQVSANSAGDLIVTDNSIGGSATGSGMFTFGRERTYTSNSTWTVPDCVTEIEIETWGAGGGGGSTEKVSWSGCGGGGGGAYSKSILQVTPGATYSIVVGSGGIKGANVAAPGGDGTDGGDTWFTNSAGSVLVLAKGGKGGTRDDIAPNDFQVGALGAKGGLASAGIGQVRFSGGDGGSGWHGSVGRGGGGGSSAGISANGIASDSGSYQSVPPTTLAPAGGGNGGNGGDGGGDDAYAGEFPGGGGGGGAGDPGETGADGAGGQLKISWERTRTYNGSGTWTVPPGITSIQVKVWGAGGGGGGSNRTFDDGQGGGGGGAYSVSTVTVTPGATYSVHVGSGGTGGYGTGGTEDGTDGGDSWFSLKGDGTQPTSTAEGILAKGGSGCNYSAAGGLNGTGGQAAAGIGDFKSSGGDGGVGVNASGASGGGGGASGGSGGDGGDGGAGNSNGSIPGTAGVAPTGGFAGGIGGVDEGSQTNGNNSYHGGPGNIGGGGGGASSGDNNTYSNSYGEAPDVYGRGGDGSNGRILIDYTSEDPQIGDKAMPAAFICSSETDQLIHGFILTEIPLCDPLLLTKVTAVDFTTSGTYLASDVANFKLYYSSTDNFATATLLATNNSPAAAGLQTDFSFAGSPVTLISDTEVYFWITMDASSTAGGGRTLAVTGTANSNLTGTQTFSFSADASGTQTFQDLSLSSSLTPPAICSGAFTYTATSTNGAATFAWSRAAYAGITEAATSTSGTGNINENLTNTTASSIDVTYSYVLTANGCSGAAQNVVATINPIPTMSSASSATICSGETVNIPLTSSAPASYTWIATDNANTTGESVAMQTTSTLTNTITNTSTAIQTVTYTVTPTGTAGSCLGSAQVVSVTVNPTPVLTSALSPSTICSGTSFTYTPTSDVAGTSYTWSRSANADITEATTTGTGGVNEVLTNSSAANVNVTYVYTATANNCANVENVVPLVRPNPQGSFTGNTRCAGDAGSFGQLTWTATAGTGPFVVDTTASQAGVTSGVAYSLPVSTPTVTSVYTLSKVTDAFGCERTAGFTAGTATVTVTGAAISYTNGTPASATTCAGTAVTFTVTASNVNSYTWEVSTDGGTIWDPINAAGAGPVYSNFNTSELTVSNPTVAHSGYKYRSVMIPACGPNITSDVADLTVNVLPVLSSSTGAGAAGTVCSAIAPVTYTPTSVTPGTTFAWTRLGQAGITEATSTGTGNINETLTNTTTSPIVVTYNYVSTALGCNEPAGEDVLATINPDADINLTSAAGTDDQFICLNDTVVNIIYVFNEGATGATVTGLPTGLSAVVTTNTVTISGTATQEGVFTHTVQTTGICNQTNITGKVTVGLNLVTTGTDTQSVCKGAAITPIAYNVGSSNATVAGLPTGVSGNYAGGVFTISGNPSVEGTFNYTVTTSGTCTTPTGTITNKTGVITVGVGLADTSASPIQSVCLGTNIDTIVYNVVGGDAFIRFKSDDPTVAEFPAGLDTAYNAANKTFVISGTSTISGTFDYTVTSQGTCASRSSLTGSLTFGSGLSDTSGAPIQSVCLGANIDTIVYNVVGGGAFITFESDDPTIGEFPTGLDTAFNAASNTYVISGTSSISGAFDYTVTSQGTCANPSKLTGTLIFGSGLSDTSGAPIQSRCLGERIDTIVYNVVGGGAYITFESDDPTVAEYPVGLDTTYNAANNTYLITGTSAISGTFDYTVTSQGTCAAASKLTGSLTFGSGLADTSGSPLQSVCLGERIDTIVYNEVGGGAYITFESDDPTVVEFPTGIDTAYYPATKTYVISGISSVSGTFDYTVTSQGTCAAPSQLTGSLTFGSGLSDTSGAPIQSVCLGDNIDTIIYNVVGGGAFITFESDDPTIGEFPTGLDTVYNALNNTYVISGTSGISGTFDYTVTSQGTCAAPSQLTGSLTFGSGLSDTSGAPIQSVCLGDNIDTIVYNVVGGGAYITFESDDPTIGEFPTGLDTAYNAANNTYVISGTSGISGAFDYTVTSQGTCANPSKLTGALIFGSGLSDTSGVPIQSVCLGDNIDTIVYNVVGGGAYITFESDDPTIGEFPTGLDTTYNALNNTYVISGTSAVSGTFDYTVTSQGTCANPSKLTGSLTFGSGLSDTSGAPIQGVCFGENIDTIVYNVIGGDAFITFESDDTTVVNFPTGLDTNYVAGNNTYVISGTSAVAGTFDYTVTSKGTCANPSKLTGTLTFGVGLADTSGSSIQSICKGDAIDTIVYDVIGGDAYINFSSPFPTGIDTGYVAANNTYTISGTPTVEGTYDYTVISKGTCLNSSSLQGRITVGGGLIPGGGSNVQEVCKNTPIQPIYYEVVGGVWGISGLPPGVNATENVTKDTVTISGAPSAEGTYTYTLIMPGCTNVSIFTGEITSGIGSPVAGNNIQSPCVATAINDIVYPLPSFVTGITVTNLPPGVDTIMNTSRDTVRIAGIPTVQGTYNYVITALSPCANPPSTLTGVITVKGDTLIFNSNNANQTICLGDDINNLSYDIFVADGLSSAVSLSPAGTSVDGNYNATTGKYEVSGGSGLPTGTHTFTVQTTGACGAGVKSDAFSILVVNPIADYTVDNTSGIAPLVATFTNNSNSDALENKWYFGLADSTSTVTNPTFMYSSAGLFTSKLVVSYSGGICSDSTTIDILVNDLQIANVFTPNLDNINDVFKLNPDGIAEIDATIYNRWGGAVFNWTLVNEGWDGKNIKTGLDCPAGTYYYVIRFVDKIGSEFERKGTIQLIR